MTTKALKPTTQKSFYGKATVYELENGAKLLKSYTTIVCEIDENGNFNRRWNGWSATTAKHVNAFRETYGMPSINKATWCKMKVA